MAAIDKIYGTTEQYDEFKKWLSENKPSYLKHLYPRDGYTTALDRPISNFPQEADKWLYENCPIAFVVERIKEQYGGKKL